MIVDTQVLSYHFKCPFYEIGQHPLAISSVTANEFLLAQCAEGGHPDYCIPHPASHRHLSYSTSGLFWSRRLWANRRFAKLRTHLTDRIILDFGSQFPPYCEYGNEAIAEVINGKLFELYVFGIAHLPKAKQKYLRKRMRYILETDYLCYPLNSKIIDRALILFERFVTEYNCKGNVRNTLNDILILATAIEMAEVLVTHDNLLNRFSAHQYNASTEEREELLLIDFSEKEAHSRKEEAESKGYVNRGWSYSIRRGRSVPGV